MNNSAIDYDLDEALTDAARTLAAAMAEGYVPYSELRPQGRQARIVVKEKGRTLLYKATER